MKAIQMTQHGSPEVLHLFELPDLQPGRGEVSLEVNAVAVDFSATGKVVLNP